MSIKSLVLLFVFFAGVMSACNRDDTVEKWAEEEAKLADWIKENKPDAVFENGIYIEKINTYKDNIQPEAGDHLLVNYTRFRLEEDIIEQVSYKDWQTRGALYPSTYREGGPELWPPLSDLRLSTGIDHLREKERAYVYVPSRMLKLQDFITRKIEIVLVKVIETDLKTYQEELMRCTMTEFGNNIDTITIKDSGRDYYVIYNVEEGKGDGVDISSVRTSYTESYFLQNGDPRTCVTNKTKIGWDKKFTEMFQTVKKGGKITVVMPYRIMYGEDPYNENKQYIAPPGSVLMYEIKIEN